MKLILCSMLGQGPGRTPTIEVKLQMQHRETKALSAKVIKAWFSVYIKSGGHDEVRLRSPIRLNRAAHLINVHMEIHGGRCQTSHLNIAWHHGNRPLGLFIRARKMKLSHVLNGWLLSWARSSQV